MDWQVSALLHALFAGVALHLGVSHLLAWIASQRRHDSAAGEPDLHAWTAAWCGLTLVLLTGRFLQRHAGEDRALGGLGVELSVAAGIFLLPFLVALPRAIARVGDARRVHAALFLLASLVGIGQAFGGWVARGPLVVWHDAFGWPIYALDRAGPLALPYILALLVAGTYGVVVLWRARGLRPAERRGVAIGMAIYLGVGAHDTFHALGFIHSVPMFEFAFAGMAMALDYLQSRRHARLRARLADEVERQTAELSRRNRQLEQATAGLDAALGEARAASRARDALLRNASHQLRTPLHGIVGYAELIEREADDASTRERARTIRDLGASMLDLVDALLSVDAGGDTVARRRGATLDPCEMLGMLARHLALIAHRQRIEVVAVPRAVVSRSVRLDVHALGDALYALAQATLRTRHPSGLVLSVEHDDEGHLALAIRPPPAREAGDAPADAHPRNPEHEDLWLDFGGLPEFDVASFLAQLAGAKLDVTAECARLVLAAHRVGATTTGERPQWADALRGAEVAVVHPEPITRAALAEALALAGAVVYAAPEPAGVATPRADAVLLDATASTVRSWSVQARHRWPDARVLATLPVGSPSRSVAPVDGVAVHYRPMFFGALVDGLCDGPAEEGNGGIEPEARAQPRSVGPQPVRARPRVLAADDEPVNRTLITAQLQRLGCEVTTAVDGAEALRLALDPTLPPWDLVLLDCRMPELEGQEVARRIRAADSPRARVPLVAVTAHAVEADLKRCREAGFDEVLVKPVGVEALRAVIERHVERGKS